jgi:hypothetical protein
MNVHVRLGSLSLSDDSGTEMASPSFKKLMFIEGEHLAEFEYLTFDPQDPETEKGVNSFSFFHSYLCGSPPSGAAFARHLRLFLEASWAQRFI